MLRFAHALRVQMTASQKPRLMHTYNRYLPRQQQLEQQLANAKLDVELEEILNDSSLDDATALVLVGRKLNVLKPNDTLPLDVKLDTAALLEEFRRMQALRKVQHLFLQYDKCAIPEALQANTYHWFMDSFSSWNSQHGKPFMDLSDLRKYASWGNQSFSERWSFKTVLEKAAFGKIAALAAFDEKAVKVADLLRVPGIYAYAAGRVWEGNTPTLKTLQKVAEGRMSSPSELTLEHRKLDKYFTEEQQMHLMYMKDLDTELSPQERMDIINTVRDGLQDGDGDYIVQMDYRHSHGSSTGISIDHPKYKGHPVVEDIRELRQKIGQIIELVDRPVSEKRKEMKLIGRIKGSKTWRLIKITIPQVRVNKQVSI